MGICAPGVALTLLIGSVQAAAASPRVIGGKLNGATGLVVGNSVYNVEFADGPCTSLFSGCDQATDFTFTSLNGARSAAIALLDQVLLDTIAGRLDSDYWLTYGCARNSSVGCSISIPYGVIAGTLQVENVVNTPGIDSVMPGLSSASFDTSSSDQFVYARFSATVPVPEPASWAMMLSGFCAIGFLRAQQTRRLSAAQNRDRRSKWSSDCELP